MHDVVVVGGGVIGLSIAREVAARGRSVLLVDRGVEREASSWAAAGMLAPQSEAITPEPLFELGVASLRIYRQWARSLFEQTGIDPEYGDPGLLCLAGSEAELAGLKQRMEWQRQAGFAADLLGPEAVRRMEPQITLPQLTGAVYMAGEHQVTPRRLLEALRAGCIAAGVESRIGAPVDEVLHTKNGVDGVRVSGVRIPAHTVVIAGGASTTDIAGLLPHLPVRPRKGQIMALKSSAPAFGRIIRWGSSYFVPRRSGELVVGATNEESGFDRSLTPAGVGLLMAKAQEISAPVGSYPILDMWSGLRPATPDGLPVIGCAGIQGLVYASGHYRNGILLAPITAAITAALIDGQDPGFPLTPFSPGRFEV